MQIITTTANNKHTTRRRINRDGRNFLGKMDVQCPNCKALHWINEKSSDSSLKQPKFVTCCHKGKIRLPPLREPPTAIRELLEGSKDFRKNIRNYNAANAYTSLGCKYDTRAPKGKGPWCFSIHGELRHTYGSLTSKDGVDPVYSQLYIYDLSHAL